MGGHICHGPQNLESGQPFPGARLQPVQGGFPGPALRKRLIPKALRVSFRHLPLPEKNRFILLASNEPPSMRTRVLIIGVLLLSSSKEDNGSILQRKEDTGSILQSSFSLRESDRGFSGVMESREDTSWYVEEGPSGADAVSYHANTQVACFDDEGIAPPRMKTSTVMREHHLGSSASFRASFRSWLKPTR